MRPTSVVFRTGDTIATMWFDGKLDMQKSRKFMVFCHGLPSHPYQHNPAKVEKFLEMGYVLVYPDYAGTWASYGTMSWEKCTGSVVDVVNLLKKGKCTELYGNKEIKWPVGDIILVGVSFGGAIALVAGAKSRDVKKIISIAGPTNWRDHSRIEGEESEPIGELYYSIKRGWDNLWRIPSKNEWKRLVDGSADINPVDYIDILKDKDVFLIHGTEDSVVSPKRSVDLNNSLKKGKGRHEIVLLDGERHLNSDVLMHNKVNRKLLKWLD
mgnify:CR=1 FL=1